MNLNLKDKIVLITGGAGLKGSIGRTIVLTLVEEGAIPIVLDRNERGFEFEKELQKKMGKARFFQVDLSKPEEVRNCIEQIKDEFAAIDVVINKVGINDKVGLDSSVEAFVESLHLNLISYYATVKYDLPLLKNTKGNILNTGSKVAMTGQGGTSGYGQFFLVDGGYVHLDWALIKN